jgi:D-beta-D-heptose 7-phosphate kinase / D-beta-D-heptose 1-phosphate adenosyltransferase
MSTLLDALSRWKPFTALVVGDFMLDVLVYGNVDRLANDAPVPILHVQRTEHRPGGSANVALDLIAMRGKVHTLGITGSDDAATKLRASLEASGITASGLIADPSRPTTVKRSLIGLAQHRHAQKMFRIDEESTEPIDAAIAGKLLAHARSIMHQIDVVCLEDYNKGVCTPNLCQGLIALAREFGKPVLVDPASISDYTKYRGASAITPNRTEAEKAAGRKLPDTAPPEAYAPLAEHLQQALDLDAAIITLDKSGALFLERDGEPRAVPTFARQVYDVTGAGDMVLAALAAARANGLDYFASVRFANAAAGLEVEQFGVVPIPLEQIHRDLLLRERATRGKLRTWQELEVEVSALRTPLSNHTTTKPPSIVLANGCFDVLHAGHVSLLRRAAELGDFLIVAINDDASVKKLKGPTRPVYPVEDRAALLGELECVGAVVVFGEDTPEALIRRVQPDVLVKGAQYQISSIPGAQFVLDRGGRVELLDVVPGKSTTATVQKMRQT